VPVSVSPPYFPGLSRRYMGEEMRVNIVRATALQGGVCTWRDYDPAPGGPAKDPFLLVFPAFTGLGLLEGIEQAQSWQAVLDLARRATDLEGRLVETARDLAVRTGAVVVPGSVILPAGDGFVHRSYVVSAGGVLGRQDQTHAGAFERAWPLVPGSRLEPVETPVGWLGILLGADAFYPEAARILSLQGADILCVPTAIPAPYNQWRQIPGVWAQVQQNQVYAVEACLVGRLGGSEWAGVSAVHGPVEITPGDSGYLNQAPAPDRAAEVTANLDFTALRSIRTSYPIFSFLNRPLYRRFMPGIYRGGARHE